jgi:uncharacterized SAM-binding protein YcdF (DUF218 family)
LTRRWRVALLASAALCALGVWGRDAPARWLVIEDPARPVDAALVLAGDPDYERTSAAARLVMAGEARLLVVTGGEVGPGDSATSLRAFALQRGVAPDRIRMEQISHSTRQALVAVGPLLREENVRTVALVTSPYHQRRAWLAARKALPGIRLVNRPAASSWTPVGWWRTRRSRQIVFSEYAKLAYYAARGWL